MKKNSWILKALMLGTVFFVAVLFAKPIGVSTQFSVLSGIFHSALDETVIVEDAERASGYSSTNAYYDKSEGKLAKSIQHPWNYDFVFVLAIPVGGYIASQLFRKKRNESTQEAVTQKKQFTLKDYLPSFFGGAILLYGARMAGGCTSGHMMSGMMQGSISGYIFAASVFAIAIPLAILLGKANKKRG